MADLKALTDIHGLVFARNKKRELLDRIEGLSLVPPIPMPAPLLPQPLPTQPQPPVPSFAEDDTDALAAARADGTDGGGKADGAVACAGQAAPPRRLTHGSRQPWQLPPSVEASDLVVLAGWLAATGTNPATLFAAGLAPAAAAAGAGGSSGSGGDDPATSAALQVAMAAAPLLDFAIASEVRAAAGNGTALTPHAVSATSGGESEDEQPGPSLRQPPTTAAAAVAGDGGGLDPAAAPSRRPPAVAALVASLDPDCEPHRTAPAEMGPGRSKPRAGAASSMQQQQPLQPPPAAATAALHELQNQQQQLLQLLLQQLQAQKGGGIPSAAASSEALQAAASALDVAAGRGAGAAAGGGAVIPGSGAGSAGARGGRPRPPPPPQRAGPRRPGDGGGSSGGDTTADLLYDRGPQQQVLVLGADGGCGVGATASVDDDNGDGELDGSAYGMYDGYGASHNSNSGGADTHGDGDLTAADGRGGPDGDGQDGELGQSSQGLPLGNQGGNLELLCGGGSPRGSQDSRLGAAVLPWLAPQVISFSQARVASSEPLISSSQLLGRRVAFALLSHFVYQDVRAGKEVLPPGMYQGRATESLGGGCQQDVCGGDEERGCGRDHDFFFVRVMTQSQSSLSIRGRLELKLDLASCNRVASFQQLVGLSVGQLQDAWVLLGAQEGPPGGPGDQDDSRPTTGDHRGLGGRTAGATAASGGSCGGIGSTRGRGMGGGGGRARSGGAGGGGRHVSAAAGAGGAGRHVQVGVLQLGLGGRGQKGGAVGGGGGAWGHQRGVGQRPSRYGDG